MDFEALMSSIEHNFHHVHRYLCFIFACTSSNTGEGVHENHHILPKSIWPEFSSFKDYPDNCARLTSRQHFIAHCMLLKCFTGSHKRSMAFALKCMKGSNTLTPRYFNSTTYERFRQIVSESASGEGNNMFGKTHTPEARAKISKTNKGIKRTDIQKAEQKELFRTKGHPRKDTKHNDESKERIRLAALNRPLITCPFCQKTGKTNMNRYHFDNCKLKPA
jgi:hypothetical protein